MIRARYNGIPIWLDEEDYTMQGRTRFAQLLVRIMVFIDVRILGLEWVDVKIEE